MNTKTSTRTVAILLLAVASTFYLSAIAQPGLKKEKISIQVNAGEKKMSFTIEGELKGLKKKAVVHLGWQEP